MNRIPALTLGLAGIVLLLGASRSLPADEGHEAARRLLEAGEIVPLEQIVAAIERERPGRIIEVELERKRQRYVYEIELLTPDGTVLELYYDASTGDHLGGERGE